MAAQEGSEGGSPTPHGEAARAVYAYLHGEQGVVRTELLRTMLEEHGEMVQLLRECVHFASPDGFTRIHVHAFLRKLGGSPEPEAEPAKFEAGDRVYIRTDGVDGRIEGRVAHPVGSTGSVQWDGSDCHTVHAASDFEDGTIQRVPVPDPEPDKLPAAPKVEVGQVWKDVGDVLWRVTGVRHDQDCVSLVRVDGLGKAEIVAAVFVAPFTLVSSPTDASDALDQKEVK